MIVKVKQPTVVLLDIETSPLVGYAWQTYDTNILKVLQPSKIISVAYKRLHEDKVHVKSIADYKGYKKGEIDDKQLVADIWTVMDKADILIAHHGDSFDIKKLNARFVYYGLTAPSPYKSIDTLKVAKRVFKFDSNSLNNLGQYLGVGEKITHSGFSMWVRCIEDGDPESWKLMKEYNSQDVTLLERVYLRLRPYIQGHPNLNAITADETMMNSCPSCQSTNVVKRGFSITKTGRKQRFQCSDCGSWSEGPYTRIKNILSSDED